MDLLEAGRVAKTKGLNGSMKVVSFLSNGSILQSIKEVFIKREKQEALPFTVKRISIKNTVFFLDLVGIDDIDAAQSLVGSQVMIPSKMLEELPGDEYYWHELMGMSVVTEDGKPLGKIESIFPTGSNDVYVCSGGEREILIPAIADVVRNIDRRNRLMVIRLIEGL
jgi:16S rRNA processing protein RimM